MKQPELKQGTLQTSENGQDILSPIKPTVSKKIQRRDVLSNDCFLPENLHPVLKRIYHNRNISDAATLDKSLTKLLPYSALKNIKQAADLLCSHFQQKSRLIVIGDFDADGATSTAVAIKCLRMLGASDVDFLVPDRFKFGYGLTTGIVEQAAESFFPDLIITVDNGISSIDGVERANELGIEVLVTDHHLAGAELPNAAAIVNPNQPGDEFKSKNLAGVGVIFYVMLALRSRLHEIDWFEKNQIAVPNLGSVLDIVALGTVADVVPLDFNNRILVNQGLKRVRAGHACPGIQALIEVSNRNHQTLVATDFGFCLGPRLNAAGRLEDMSIGINCLLSETLEDARQIATRLDSLNKSRRQIESQMQQDANQVLNKLDLDNTDYPMGMCLFDKSWHQGVIGILASRIKDKLHRPVIIFAEGDEGEIKGSARSIPHIHIRDILDSVATANPGLILKFGGHAMAAGMSIDKENFDEFKRQFNNAVKAVIKPEHLEQVILSDGELKPEDIEIQLADLLKNIEPWGQAFPEPVFDGEFSIVHHKVVGEKHLKLRLQPENSTAQIDAIAFNVVDREDQASPVTTGDTIQVAYKLDVNEFRGNRNIQLIVEYFEQAENTIVEMPG